MESSSRDLFILSHATLYTRAPCMSGMATARNERWVVGLIGATFDLDGSHSYYNAEFASCSRSAPRSFPCHGG